MKKVRYYAYGNSPQEGGADAELFVQEFSEAIAKHSGKKAAVNGTMRFLECL